ncbi:unnamed protein product, partial [Mesorhabditis spiculigera]
MPRSMFWVFLGLLLHIQIADGISAKYQQQSSSSEEEDSNWQCGTDFITKAMSEGQVETDCPTLKVPINNCCLAHDNCYDQQLGRKYCDDIFCRCLLVATEPAEICFKEDAPLFCSLVRQFGEAAYNASGPLARATPPPLVATTPETRGPNSSLSTQALKLLNLFSLFSRHNLFALFSPFTLFTRPDPGLALKGSPQPTSQGSSLHSSIRKGSIIEKMPESHFLRDNMLVAVFVALLLIGPAYSVRDWWQCGSNDANRLAAYESIDGACSVLAEVVNNCCLAHDHCYSRQLGQEYCDDMFCDCHLIATKGWVICHTVVVPGFCSLVRNFGDAAYKASATPGPKALLPPGDAQHQGDSTHS